jgi:hypothetical protein
LPRRAGDCWGRNRAAPSWYVALPGRIALPKLPLTRKAEEYPFRRRARQGQVSGKSRRSFARFGLQDAQTPPSPRVGEGGRGMLTEVDVLASPCAPSPVSAIRTLKLSLLPSWEKGAGG